MTVSSPPQANGPLRDERVLDLSHHGRAAGSAPSCWPISGPTSSGWMRRARTSTMTSRRSLIACTSTRSKRSMVLDLRSASDRDVVLQLVADRDVVIADGPESELSDLGLDLAVLRAVNPAVILTVVSGFGSEGPLA